MGSESPCSLHSTLSCQARSNLVIFDYNVWEMGGALPVALSKALQSYSISDTECLRTSEEKYIWVDF